MSAKRSFDIGPNRKEAPAAKPRRRRRVGRPRKATPPKEKNLRQRRQEARERMEFVGFFIFLALMAAFLYGLWRPEVRMLNLSVSGAADPEAVEMIAREELSGTYYLALPKDSFFWYPERNIEAAIMQAYPGIADVKIRRAGFSSLSIAAESRARAFLWCGTPEASSGCYDADEGGFVYAPASEIASGTPMLRVRSALNLASSTDGTPIRGQVVGSDLMPKILRFADVIEAMGTPIVTISIRGDEADLYAESGTRITYVIGYEDQAARDARAAFQNLNLMDGSIAYVDLRFPGKVYLKRIHE